MKKLFSTLALFAAVYFSAHAQLSLSNVRGITEAHPCVQDTFEVAIAKTTGSFTVSDTIKINLAFPEGITLGVLHSASNGTLAITSQRDSSAALTITGLSDTSVTLTYGIIPRCRAFSVTTRTGLVNTVTARLNTLAAVALNTLPYTLTTPVLVFDQSQSRNLRTSNAPFNLPFDRFYVFKNTSSAPFTGDIFFTDTVQLPQQTSALRIDTAIILHPLTASVTTAIVNDSTVCIHAHINGLAEGDSLVIKETVKLVKCATTRSNTSRAFMISKFACTADTIVCPLAQSFETSATLSGTPVIAFDQVDLSEGMGQLNYLCPAIEEKRIFRVINTGTAMADSVHFELNRGGGTFISYFDKNSVQVYKYDSGGVKTPVPFIVRLQQYAASIYIPFDSLFPIGAYRFSTKEGLLPGDTLFMSFIEKKVCIDSAAYRFNEDIFMGQPQRSIGATLGHPCFPSRSFLSNSRRASNDKRPQFFR